MRCLDLLLPIWSSCIVTISMEIKKYTVKKTPREGKIFSLILRYNISSSGACHDIRKASIYFKILFFLGGGGSC
jgi:hypothetical protein